MADETPRHPRRPMLRERVERNAAIARRRAEGRTIRQLADEFGLAKATVGKALREAAEVAAAGPVAVEALDLGEIVGAGLRAHGEALDRVTELLDHESPNARVGAANSISKLLASLVSSLRALGAIGDQDFERERVRLGDEVREIAERMARPPSAWAGRPPARARRLRRRARLAASIGDSSTGGRRGGARGGGAGGAEPGRGPRSARRLGARRGLARSGGGCRLGTGAARPRSRHGDGVARPRR
jgi:hypothetical protein